MIKKFTPLIIRKIWGGERLAAIKNLSLGPNQNLEPIGETIEIYGEEFLHVVKLIDTSDNLSIQVHPFDDYVKAFGLGNNGKDECWIILDAKEDACVYLGLKPQVTKDVLLKALRLKTAINDLLNCYPVKKGDFFYIPAGSIHAIGKNVTLAEVQQNTDITFRVWDWNRIDRHGVARNLHIDQSLEVIFFEEKFNNSFYFKIKHDLFNQRPETELLLHHQFQLFLFNLKKGQSISKDISTFTRPSSLLSLEGSLQIFDQKINPYQGVALKTSLPLEVTALEDCSFLLIL